jgi:predicted nuclease of predicted toxin-antitoxin system
MAARPRLRFFLDNCVPVSVGEVLRDAGHEVIHQGQSLALNAADILVAIASAENETILVTQDRDFRAIASRYKVSQGKLRKLSRIEIIKCEGPKAAQRVEEGMEFIEMEWMFAQKRTDKRLFLVIQPGGFKTNR